ncbi:tagaturonate reductase [Pedobacter sp. SD-b]|uniref:Tagaturonate reductase n=1 Tax=Pedobacter segetis TaxID=2793069 RepID=A0ABS1BJM8_9SPHI|nr:tagaturonate reductase [Pedobacter segetis]MBK0383088.1 tagaturonate reductase [Pedobacter segetis]
MILNKKNISLVLSKNITKPQTNLFDLPEKVLQFGTGVLLRGLPDYFIDKANREGFFNGRIVVVKSTDHGNTDEFDHQDNLYTVCVKGIEKGKTIEQNIVSSAISRVLTASKQWDQILDFAASDSLEIVISNTTEVGITLIDDDVNSSPPSSFPGKLLAILHHRYKTFNGAIDKGLVIVPTELIVDNATKLKTILLKLCERNNLSPDFINWLQESNHFCNSLVDRIVPGKPDNEQLNEIKDGLGYEDNLLIMSEAYRLWAIEGNEKVKEKLSFAKADSGVIITPDINLHRELKLRLLNGTHTLSCGLAFLAGFDTVKSAMDDEDMESYIRDLMINEIAPSIPYEVSKEQTDVFAANVLDRFRNPYIKHQWLSITSNYTSKLNMRVVPVLKSHYKNHRSAPVLIALGFAAYIRFMKPSDKKNNKFYGRISDQDYLINDSEAEYVTAFWHQNPDKIVNVILADVSLWGTDLTSFPHFESSVNNYLKFMDDKISIKQLMIKESVNI